MSYLIWAPAYRAPSSCNSSVNDFFGRLPSSVPLTCEPSKPLTKNTHILIDTGKSRSFTRQKEYEKSRVDALVPKSPSISTLAASRPVLNVSTRKSPRQPSMHTRTTRATRANNSLRRYQAVEKALLRVASH